MNQHRRRLVLKTAAATVGVSLAGCLFGSGDEGSGSDTDADGEPGEDVVEDTETDTDPEDQSDEDMGDNGETQQETDRNIAVGNQPYTRWIPEPKFRSGSDGSINSMAFTYVDGAALRSIEDSLPDDAELLRTDALPFIEEGRTDELLLFQTPLLEPELEIFTPPRVILGEFDRQRVVDSYLNYDEIEWDDQTEYDGFTFLVSNMAGEERDETPVSIGVSESVVLYRTHTAENQGTAGIEMIADAEAGRRDRIHEIESDIARIFEYVRGSTIVFLNYGEQFQAQGENIPDGVLGIGGGFTVGEQETEEMLVFPATDEASASAALNDDEFPRENEDVSESVEGSFYILRQTTATEEFDRIPSL